MANQSRRPGAKKALIIGAVIVAVVGGVYFALHSAKVVAVASAYYAKTLCSSLFVAGRDERAAVFEDVLADMTVGLHHWHHEVYRERNLVEVKMLGMAKREALYRPGLGCTLALDSSVEALIQQAESYVVPLPAKRSAELWPDGERVALYEPRAGVDVDELKEIIEAAFFEPRPKRALRRTQAVIVVHKGEIIAEKYGEGITPQMPRPGWSIGKTVLSALIGTLVREKRFELEKDALFPEWSGTEDPRRKITGKHLLQMVSGLDFDAPHARMLSDVRKMLFVKGDSAAYAKSEELADPVGSTWFYASGSTTLLASAMKDAIDGPQAQYFSYPWKALFEPLGMHTAVMEPDAAGTFLAPAFVHASARDWARFGQFYLQDGVWEGKRILPEGWVAMQREATKQSSGEYGAHLWLKIPEFLRPASAQQQLLPEDAFFMLGHDGQMIAIIPSRDLVVVRLGLTRRRNAWDHEVFLRAILTAFK